MIFPTARRHSSDLVFGFTDAKQIKPTAHFSNDLALDSLDTVEVVMAIEEVWSHP